MLLADYIHSQVRIENFNSGQGGRVLVLRCRSLMATDFSRKLIFTWTVWKNFMRLWTILKQLIFEFTVNSFYMYLGWSVFFWLWLTQVCVTSFVLHKCNFSFSPKVVQFGIETKFPLDCIALHFWYGLRLCCNWEPVFSWWSSPLLLWPQCVVQGWYCKEKLDAGHSWSLKVKSNYYISRSSLCSQCSSESEGDINSCEKIWAKHL